METNANIIGSMIQKESRKESGRRGSRQPLVERADRSKPDEDGGGQGEQGAKVVRYNLYDASRTNNSLF